MPKELIASLGDNITENNVNKPMQAKQDYIENKKSASEGSVPNVERTEETTKGKDIGVKNVEMASEVSVTKGGGKEESQGEYLYFQTFF